MCTYRGQLVRQALHWMHQQLVEGMIETDIEILQKETTLGSHQKCLM